MGNILSSCRAKSSQIVDQPTKLNQTHNSSSQTEDVFKYIIQKKSPFTQKDKFNKNFSKYYNHNRSRRNLAIYDTSSDSSSNFQINNHLSKSFSSSDLHLAKNFTIKLEFKNNSGNRREEKSKQYKKGYRKRERLRDYPHKLIVPSKSAVYLNKRKQNNFRDSFSNNSEAEEDSEIQNYSKKIEETASTTDQNSKIYEKKDVMKESNLINKVSSSSSSNSNTNKVFNNLYNQVSDASSSIKSETKNNQLIILNTDGCNSEDLKLELESVESFSNIEHIDSIKSGQKRLATICEALNESRDNFFKKISEKELKKNLEFVLRVLENCLDDERKRIESDDDVLSEIEPELVSSEVRNWLSMTFTRSVSSLKKKEDKPKFKSVAHAIRAGIMVDRMLRRMSSSLESNVPSVISKHLKTINEWNFEVFQLNESSDGQALRYLGFELMQKFNILTKFKIQNLVMQNFLEAVEKGYSKYKNPYHNLVHAADVLQTLYNILNNAGLLSWLSSIEIFAVFISAIVHDYEHTGTTNNFHIQTGSDIALIYNDRAVLENYHISTTFRLMKDDNFNILQELSREEYKEFRNLCIEMILATDMSYHFSQLKTIKNMISLNEPVDKPKALSLILHCADISHPAKEWHLHEVWTNALVQEFFAQGDKEKELGLPFSPLCDRNNTPIAQSQIGFINFIVEPSMIVMGDMIDRLVEQITKENRPSSGEQDEEKEKLTIARPWVKCLTENKAKWTELAEEDKQKKEAEAQAKQDAEANEKSEINEKALDKKQ